MSYYDEDFKPWEIVDGQCVVADEAEWKRINQINRSAYSNYLDWVDSGGEQPPRPVVKVPTDIFEDVEGQVFDQSLKPVFTNEHITTQRPLTVNDLLTRFFQTVDATPHVDYLLVTQRPELVRDKWPRWHRETMSGRDEWEETLENVTLAVPVETQSDIERLVPELLKCHDLCKGCLLYTSPSPRDS